jgi:restriction system protein
MAMSRRAFRIAEFAKRFSWLVCTFLAAFGFGLAVFNHLGSPLHVLGLSLGVLCAVAAAAALFIQAIRGRVSSPQLGPQSLRDFPLGQVQSLLAGAYGRLGYDNVDDPKGGGADGVDIRLYKAGRLTLVQSKYWRDDITEPMISALFDAMTAEKAAAGIVVTTAEFTPEARRFAQGKPITLIDGPALGELVEQHPGHPVPKPESTPPGASKAKSPHAVV